MHKDRYLGTDPQSLPLARELYDTMRAYPIISPHGHVDPLLLLENKPFTNPVELLITPDHYLTRMLMSQGIGLEQLQGDPLEAWKLFAENWKLFRSTPSRIWMHEIFSSLFDIYELLTPESAEHIYQRINERLTEPDFTPQALFKRFDIEVLATTDATSQPLDTHAQLATLDLGGRVIPTFRPDDVSDPERADWRNSIDSLAAATGESCDSFAGFLEALRIRRKYFKDHGATATDHGVLNPQTLNLAKNDKEKLFKQLLSGQIAPEASATFRAVMLLEHARMASDDGLVMQLHPGSLRDYSSGIASLYGKDKGFDIPVTTTYVRELRALLEEVGFHPNFRMVIFTLDESVYSRELAPLAGAYPSIRLGPPWWFHDSLNGMERWRDAITETAGFYNTVGFIDDTRAFCSIPVRHDVARRFDAGYLSREVSRHRLTKEEALEVAGDIAYKLSKDFFNL
ncbi:unannotated protein [freshwater metagenome]|uniref:Uronate isomerase n=1 Tax=freshwater metagenome TaxID=449393 RepID=A0A6J6PSP0_9ZZZZ|nr:glucuronate isomerase [Actinomycetota bacterium]MSV64404.1 glucuronate isomerase [Actinomycetota bacterium]MSW26282.1 glucuronate isomerase [Actinomycetota bacterium]MSW34599.1 glucuronate isomerase [Actinomycetota bacterium]MSX31625.1 glucuronate isomerase [Actinomycetota bacterium]